MKTALVLWYGEFCCCLSYDMRSDVNVLKFAMNLVELCSRLLLRLWKLHYD